MIASKSAALCSALLGLAVANCAWAGVERVELYIGEPIRPLETLAAEKILRSVPGVLTVKLDLRRGALLVAPAEGRHLDPAVLPEALADLALRVTRVVATASGTLRTSAEAPTLEMEGPLPRLVLLGGATIEGPSGAPELSGKKLRISGTYTRAGNGNPPTLTVEEWAEQLPPVEAATPDNSASLPLPAP